MKLSRYEQETIINFNEEEAEASIYTHNEKLKTRLSFLAENFPSDCVYESKNGFGGVTYRISKKLIQIRQPYSEERRKRDREVALASKRRPPAQNTGEQKLQK